MGIFLDILFNLGTLISISIVSGFIEYTKISKFNKSITVGLLFGGGAIIGMLNPVVFVSGIIFDGRSILVSVAGLYYGPVSAIISAFMAIVFRVVQGGGGTLMGVLVVLTSMLIGIVFNKLWKVEKEVSTKKLLIVGYLTHIIMVLLMFFLPPDRVLTTLKSIAPMVILFYPIATLIIGKVINYVFIQKKTSAALSIYEQRLISIGNNFSNGMIYQILIDKYGNRKFTYLSKNAETLYGHAIKEMLDDANIIYNKIYPDDMKQMMHIEEEALKNLSIFKAEIRIVEPNGNMRWSMLVSTPKRLDNGDIAWDGIEFVITDKKIVEENILKSLKEKETLIREIYHRTKNTLQIIRGLLALQASEYSDNKELQAIVLETENKIQSISLVHEMLYKSKDLSKISIKEYIDELTRLIIAKTNNIALDINVDDFAIIIDILIPIGLVINEMMTNTIKYAFPNERNGTIRLSLKKIDSLILITYSDDGIGVEDDFDFRNQNTLGFKLIYAIIEQQLKGHVDAKNDNGLRLDIQITDNLYKERI